jgi:hypothetical protein
MVPALSLIPEFPTRADLYVVKSRHKVSSDSQPLYGIGRILSTGFKDVLAAPR